MSHENMFLSTFSRIDKEITGLPGYTYSVSVNHRIFSQVLFEVHTTFKCMV